MPVSAHGLRVTAYSSGFGAQRPAMPRSRVRAPSYCRPAPRPIAIDACLRSRPCPILLESPRNRLAVPGTRASSSERNRLSRRGMSGQYEPGCSSKGVYAITTGSFSGDPDKWTRSHRRSPIASAVARGDRRNGSSVPIPAVNNCNKVRGQNISPIVSSVGTVELEMVAAAYGSP